VKNVTGYDLNKLYTGCFGTLGVIEAAWLRLRPLPERRAVCEAELSTLHEASRQGLAAARLSTARAVALAIEPHEGRARLTAELAGDAESVAADAERLAADPGARPAPEAALDAVRERQAALPAPAGLRFRIAALPSRLEPALAELSRAGAALLAYPGLGLVYAALPLAAQPDEAAAARAFRLAERVAREAGGGVLCEAAPAWAKRGHDVFGALGVALPLVRTLKAGFDPEGILNPGRFVGRL
jgi:glycolate oxidase FAD binding subunit